MVDPSKFVLIDKAILRLAPWNYKKSDPELTEKLRNNMRRNGQIENIIVRELNDGTYEVVNGNHRLEVILSESSVEHVMCYNLGNINLDLAKRIAIETNETRFESDLDKLYNEMQSLLKTFDFDELSRTMPFSEDEMNDFFNMTLEIEEEEEEEEEEDTEDDDERDIEPAAGNSDYELSGDNLISLVFRYNTNDYEHVNFLLNNIKETGGFSSKEDTLIHVLTKYLSS